MFLAIVFGSTYAAQMGAFDVSHDSFFVNVIRSEFYAKAMAL